jgi:hypothetical protein
MDTDSEMTVERIEMVALPEMAKLSKDLETAPMPTLASDYTPLIMYFGIDNVDRESQEKLQNVWEHFAKDAKNPGTVLKRIKQQILSMPSPSIGDSRLNQLNNYVRVLGDFQNVKDMKEAFEA